jgi:hypothetical protein
LRIISIYLLVFILFRNGFHNLERNYHNQVNSEDRENLKTRRKMDKIHHCAVGRGGSTRKAHKDASADV